MSRARHLTTRSRPGAYFQHPYDYPGPFTHGDQITRNNIGPTGVLTPSGSITATNGQTISNLEISGTVVIPAGVSVTITNTRIIGPPGAGAAGYTVKSTAGGSSIQMNGCEVITRGSATKCLAVTGLSNANIKRTVFRGGTDNAFFNVDNSPGLIPTDDRRTPMARILIEECWFGDCMHPTGAHSDCIQIDGGGYAVIRRCNIENFVMDGAADPLTTQSVISQDTVGNSAVITSQNSSNPVQISNVVLQDNLFNGGNYTVYMTAPDGLPMHHQYMDGNKFGLYHRFAHLRFPDDEPNSSRVGDTWAYTGITGAGTSVIAGTPIPGESTPIPAVLYRSRRRVPSCPVAHSH